MATVLYYDWYIAKGHVYFKTSDVNVYQPGEYQKYNMEKVYNYFTAHGWTLNAIAGMLGNIMVESTVNPGCCQYSSVNWDNPSTILSTSGGIGLTQWTPARKYYNWAIDNGLDPLQGESQCARIEYERENNYQWSLNNYGNHTWEQFVHSTESPEILARVFVWAYERPLNPDVSQRQRNARWVYDYLSNITPGPPSPPQDEWVTGLTFADYALAYDPDITGVQIPYSQLDCVGFVNKVWHDITAVPPNITLGDDGIHYGTNTLWRSSRTFNTISPEGISPCPELWYQGTIADCSILFGGIPEGSLLFHKISDAGPPAIPPYYANDGIGNFAHIGIYVGNDQVMQSGGMDSASIPGGGVHRSAYNPNAWNYVAFVVYVDPTNIEPPEPEPPEPGWTKETLYFMWYNGKKKEVLKNARKFI